MSEHYFTSEFRARWRYARRVHRCPTRRIHNPPNPQNESAAGTTEDLQAVPPAAAVMFAATRHLPPAITVSVLDASAMARKGG